MNKIKIIMLYVVSAVMLGFLFGSCISYIYTNNLDDKYSKYKIYLIRDGEYNSYNNMVSNAKNISYVYYKDNGKYSSIIGITMDEDNIDSIKSLYNQDSEVIILYTKDEDLIKLIKEYDNKIKETKNIEDIRKINEEILKIYKDSNYDIVSELS